MMLPNMAYNLSHDTDLSPLLAPPALIRAADVLHDRNLIPDIGGVYGWWFNVTPPAVPTDGTLRHGDYRLLYIGIAPRAPSEGGSFSKSTLRKRIVGNHLGSRIASSTLRRSLAWLLAETLNLKIGMNDARKAVMSRGDEASLTNWMENHAAVSLLAHETAWMIEEAIVGSGTPHLPINIRGATHEFRAHLAALRASEATAPHAVGTRHSL